MRGVRIVFGLILLSGLALFVFGCQSEYEKRDPSRKYSRIPQSRPSDWQNSVYSQMR